MYSSTAFTLLFSSLAAASPVMPRVSYAGNSFSWTLIAQQAYGIPFLNNHVVTTIPNGAASSIAVLSAPGTTGRIFHLNGTSADWTPSNFHTRVVSLEVGAPPTPVFMSVTAGSEAVNVGTGAGSDIMVNREPEGQAVPFLVSGQGKGTFVGCERTVAGAGVTVLGYVESGVAVPEGCASVTLLAQCAGAGAGIRPSELFGTAVTHPMQVLCYEDVSKIE